MFLLTDSTNGYLYAAEVYTGKSDKQHIDELGVTGSIVVRLLHELEGKTHIVFTDRFYTSPLLYRYLYSQSILACGTVMMNRKYFPKDLVTTKKNLQRGEHKYLCSDNFASVVWCEWNPIYFLSSYHDPSVTKSVNRKNKDGTVVAVTCPELVTDYNKYMGGVDHNDQMCKLFRPRKHYLWPRRLLMKVIMWCCYNAFIALSHFRPHRRSSHRLFMFTDFLQCCVTGLIGDFTSSAIVRRRSDASSVERLSNVGVHFPERARDATGNNRCRVCREKFTSPVILLEVLDKNNPHQQSKTRMWCSACHEFLCIREGSSCFKDFHTKKEYWR